MAPQRLMPRHRWDQTRPPPLSRLTAPELPMRRVVRHVVLLLLTTIACSHTPSRSERTRDQRARVIVFVWDGVRPDAISRADTPHLYALRQEGVDFSDHHSVYPTFTMVNATALATGSFPGSNAYYGNYVFQPGPVGRDTAGKAVHFDREVAFTEDYGGFRNLEAHPGNRHLPRPTPFQGAHRPGFETAPVGRGGRAFLHDL